MFIKRRSAFSLIQLLLDRLTATNITGAQQVIGSVPWKRIYTTNYDNVVELAHARANRPIRPVTLADEPSRIRAGESLCVHINGHIGDLDSNTLQSTFVLTSAAYWTDAFNRSRWSRLFARK